MRLGRRLSLPAVVLAVLVAPTLAGCGLFDGGSNVEEAFEYLPADTFSVGFADRAAMAERLGLEDLDPRDVSDDDLDEYDETLKDERDNAVGVTTLTNYLSFMRDAPFNDLDVVWEAAASWGDDTDEPDGGARVWKVGDDVDFDALAEDLAEKGYEKDSAGDLPVFKAELSDFDESVIGGAYPQAMMNVMLDEDEQIVASSREATSLDVIADVIADEEDSLADEDSFDDLLDVADGDPEFALLTGGGDSGCVSRELAEREDLVAAYEDLRRAERRALFVSGDDAEVLLALQHESEQAAEDDLEAREALLDEGPDPRTGESFDNVGDFELRQDGEFILIEEDYDDGPAEAITAEVSGGGLGTCLPE